MSVTGNSVDASAEELEELLECVRMVMRDYAPNNILLGDVEFSDKEVERAVKMAVSEFNRIPIQTAYDWRLIPEDLLFLGTARWLMLSNSFLQIRNQVSVPSDGLGVIGIDDKYQLYFNQMQSLKSEFQTGVREYKIEMNISLGFSGFPSGYSTVSRFHHS